MTDLSAASQQSMMNMGARVVHDSTVTTPYRYASPKNQADIEIARQSAIPKKTQDDTEWCMRVWREWSLQRNVATTEQLPTFFIGDSQLHWSI